MLTLIGIFLFAFAEFLFDYAAVGGSTNWSIFYFASTYLSISLISADLLFNGGSKSVKLSGISFAVFFVVLMILELTHINVPFDEYIVSVSETKLKLVTYGLLAVVLVTISVKAWEKRLWRK